MGEVSPAINGTGEFRPPPNFAALSVSSIETGCRHRGLLIRPIVAVINGENMIRFADMRVHVESRRRTPATLRSQQSECASHLELAPLLPKNGDPDCVGTDLVQLFRRVVFNVMIGNRDDHLRNHGFILGELAH